MLPQIRLTKDIDLLAYCPLLRGMTLALAYADREGGIGLTATGAMNRRFVHWAAVHFEWPDYRAEDLYRICKVLNETDMTPLGVIRDMNQHFRFMRRQQKLLVATKNGRAFLAQPEKSFDQITHTYLYSYIDVAETQHDVRERMEVWHVYLNTINTLEDEGFTLSSLRQALGMKTVGDTEYEWSIHKELGLRVLRPLCWLGLLQEEGGHTIPWRDQAYRRTPLWAACLKLPSDEG